MKRPDRFPPYAYIPGSTPRHDEAVFEVFHDSVRPGMTTSQLSQTAAWAAGWHYFRAGYFWEAHEVLEPVWMQTPDGSPERHLVQSLIQTANAALKLQMNRPNAVRRLCDIAEDHLTEARRSDAEALMGLRFDDLAEEISRLRLALIP